MYILTRDTAFENRNNTIITITAPDIEAGYLSAGYQRGERFYKQKFEHREYIIVCPEYRNKANGGEPVVIIPEFLIPGRPYPVYIYLYAIDLYSSNPKLSQRAAAKATRKHFGLSTFSHTTLGRALKRFVENVGEKMKTGSDRQHEEGENGDSRCGNSAGNNAPVLPALGSTASLRSRASRILLGKTIQTNRQKAIGFCHELVKKRFVENRHFLL